MSADKITSSETPRTDKILSEQAFTDLDGAVDVLNQWVDFARQLERELAAERERADRSKAEGIKEGMRLAAEIAEQHASVEGIAQRIRDAILKEAGE